MKEKLKKQRNRLFLRIILIMLAVWMTVTLAFCAVRVSLEKVNVQNSELSNFSGFLQILTVGKDDSDSVRLAFTENTDLLYRTDGKNAFDTQIVVKNTNTENIIADTAGCVGVIYVIRGSISVFGLIDCEMLRESLNDDQISSITELLHTERDDGNRYELVCTRFQLKDLYIIPIELKIMLVDSADDRFIVDDDVKTFDLSFNLIEDHEVYLYSPVMRNTIPKELILNGDCNKDIIGSLSDDQKESYTQMIPQGGTKYVFFASDRLTYSNKDYAFYASEYGDKDYDTLHKKGGAWLVEYAKKVDLFDSCKTDLAIGSGLIFFFVLTIALILCVMIWRTVKSQIIQEQKRVDLTNALAHDIKTPLFVISGYAYSLKEDIDENERGLYLDKIIEQTDEVNDLVHKMLDLSKLDSYDMTLNRTEFDLYEFTHSIVNTYSALPDGKSISLTHSGDCVINADKELIATALRNLIENAVKYSLPDSEIQIAVSGRSISISNQSEPLTKAEIKQLWQPYVRKDKSRHKKGNGLGLSIVKSILDLHGAKYEIRMKDQTFICDIDFG